MFQRDDGKYGLSHLPDFEFNKYVSIASRQRQRYAVYATKPFFDDIHTRFYNPEDIIHSKKNIDSCHLSIPYINVEYSFNIWGGTYKHEFDVLFQPTIRLDRRKISADRRYRKKGLPSKLVLLHVLSFLPPDEKSLALNLPFSIIVFDVRRIIRSINF